VLGGGLSGRAGRLAPMSRRGVLAGLTLSLVSAVPAAAVCGVGIWMALRSHSSIPIRYWGGFATGDLWIASLVAAVLLIATVVGAALGRPALPETETEAEVTQ